MKSFTHFLSEDARTIELNTVLDILHTLAPFTPRPQLNAIRPDRSDNIWMVVDLTDGLVNDYRCVKLHDSHLATRIQGLQLSYFGRSQHMEDLSGFGDSIWMRQFKDGEFHQKLA